MAEVTSSSLVGPTIPPARREAGPMFEGFEERKIEGAGASIHVRVGGSGPPVLLLHGYPQTHAIWHGVAPRLAERFTTVCPDLRGYGRSDRPASGPDAAAYSKRAMAADMVAVMARLGHERFHLAGHDRGGRVAYRLALDHPQAVERLAVLDIVPTLEQFERLGRAGGLDAFHWYFLAQPSPLPETMIGRDPDWFLRTLLQRWAGRADRFAEPAMQDYLAAFRDPEVIRATCDDYRAGATIDCELDAADREAGRRIAAPLLALWGAAGRPHKRDSVLEIWRRWADRVEGAGLDCGHFLPEELPEETAERLEAFFSLA